MATPAASHAPAGQNFLPPLLITVLKWGTGILVVLGLGAAFLLPLMGRHGGNGQPNTIREGINGAQNNRNGPQQGASSAAPMVQAPIVPMPSPTSVHVPPSGGGNGVYSTPVRYDPGVYGCASRSSGYTVQLHDQNSDDLSDQNWHDAGTDPYHSNGVRFRSTTEQEFDMRIIFAPRGQCP